MSKNLWDKYYQKNQKDWKNKVRERSQNLSKEKKKSFRRWKTNVWKKYYRMQIITYYNYKKLLFSKIMTWSRI